MSDPLHRYRRKRSPETTPEPYGRPVVASDEAASDEAASDEAAEAWGRRLFVVQKHAARRLHYDVRLELDGVLLSWAVPRGPSFDPADKRLAVQVEDHPVEYADFEGLIPAGNYGAGAVIVWDRGWWRPLEDPRHGLQSGKLLFELGGYKLRGLWQLVRTKPTRGQAAPTGQPPRDWLLIKKPDAWAGPEGSRAVGEQSVLSGLDLDGLRAGGAEAAVREELLRLGAPRRPADGSAAADWQPMLAETAERPFSRPGWLFELKYDGYRLLAQREGPAVHLWLRRGSDATSSFPEVARALLALPCPRLVLDGEVVVLDDQGRPAFQRLQKRALLSRPAEVARAAVEQPATLMVFDLLAFDELDLRPLPLRVRKQLLARLIAPGPARLGPLRYAEHVEEQGEALYAEVARRGLEGVIGKNGEAPYRAGRSPQWLKIKADRTDDFAIVGFTRPAGARTGFGALHLAQDPGGEGGGALHYCGKVGTGFGEALLSSLAAELAGLARPHPRCLPPRPERAGVVPPPLPASAEDVWVEPRRCCEVRFGQRTDEGLLRHPVFLRLRDDLRPDQCVRSPAAAAPPAATVSAAAAPLRQVPLTNQKKVFWPEDGYTKGDLVEYYRAVAPAMLPWLRDRPLVITRFPDGIHGKSFFQHDAPPSLPGWFRTERIFRAGGNTFSGNDGPPREVDYLVCDSLEALLYLANLGTIPIHLWSSRVGALERPDWCVLDLDPKGAPFAHVVRLARTIHALCDEMGLPSYPKTSGQAGLHVLIPLGAQLTHEQGRDFAGLLARAAVEAEPELATMVRALDGRGGKVYLDWLQNGHGKTIAAPYCVRPQPGAPVSTPLSWREVNARLDPARFTLRTVPRRLRGAELEPPILHQTPDLSAALARLEKRLRPAPPAG